MPVLLILVHPAPLGFYILSFSDSAKREKTADYPMRPAYLVSLGLLGDLLPAVPNFADTRPMRGCYLQNG
jgi:hypothetical protein